jgi:hypothetical protein
VLRACASSLTRLLRAENRKFIHCLRREGETGARRSERERERERKSERERRNRERECV